LALLFTDAEAAGGLRFVSEAVAEALAETWDHDRAVALVEASDLVRVDAVAGVTTSDETRVQRAAALQATDELVGRLLEEVDPDHDAVLVVAPWHRAAGRHLTVAGVRAPGVEPGMLRSASTRRTGMVTLVDVAPTVLDLLGLDAPSAIEGTPFERVSGGGGSYEERVDWLATEDEASRFRDGLVTPLAATFVLVQLVLWVVAAEALRRSRWLLRQVAWTALSTLVFLSSHQVREAMQEHTCVYFGAVGGAGAVLSKYIRSAEVLAYEDLGTEAIRRLVVEDFPVVVINDVYGNDLYEEGRKQYVREGARET
jgi:hypothetical protein